MYVHISSTQSHFGYFGDLHQQLPVPILATHVPLLDSQGVLRVGSATGTESSIHRGAVDHQLRSPVFPPVFLTLRCPKRRCPPSVLQHGSIPG